MLITSTATIITSAGTHLVFIMAATTIATTFSIDDPILEAEKRKFVSVSPQYFMHGSRLHEPNSA